MEAAMLKWFRKSKKRQQPEEKQEKFLACPNRECDEWATKKTLDQALVTPPDGNLTCERCGETSTPLDWQLTGNGKAIIEETAKRVAKLQAELNQLDKPPESN
jgi:hypothetical protein